MKLGIIGAMDVELQTILQTCSQLREYSIGKTLLYTGKIGNQEVVVMKCGIGKVNAAMGTQIMVDKFSVDAIINTGIAGAIHPNLRVGDIVLSSKVAHHDVDVQNFGYEKGQVPGLPLWFEADSRLIKLIRDHQELRKGAIVSGDQFVRDAGVKKEIEERFGALCVEMEGAAIAQVASQNEVPFVIVRAISDQADAESTISYEEFEEKAAMDCARLVLKVASQLGEMHSL